MLKNIVATTDIKEEVVMNIMERLQSTEIFVGEQLPLLFQEILSIGFWESIFIIVSVIMCTSIPLVYVYMWFFTDKIDKFKNNLCESDKNFMSFVTISIGVLSAVIMIIITINEARLILEICVSPRMYLLEKIANILSGSA